MAPIAHPIHYFLDRIYTISMTDTYTRQVQVIITLIKAKKWITSLSIIRTQSNIINLSLIGIREFIKYFCQLIWKLVISLKVFKKGI